MKVNEVNDANPQVRGHFFPSRPKTGHLGKSRNKPPKGAEMTEKPPIRRTAAKRRVFGRGYEGSWGKRQGPSPYSHLWTVVRKEALLRDGHQCQLRLPGCLGRATEVDHIVSVADGGENTLENARAVCRSCHRKRTAQQGAAASKKARQRTDREEG